MKTLEQVERNDKVVEIARYFVDKSSTVRDTAKEFGISKSLVHKRLKRLISTPNLYAREQKLVNDVEKLLAKNKSERHFRGGAATKRKYAKR